MRTFVRGSAVLAVLISSVACASLTRRGTAADQSCDGQRMVTVSNRTSIPLELVGIVGGARVLGVIDPGSTLSVPDDGGGYDVRPVAGTERSMVRPADNWVFDVDRRKELIRYVCAS